MTGKSHKRVYWQMINASSTQDAKFLLDNALDAGLDIHHPGLKHKQTLLQRATKDGYASLVDLLLRRGADKGIDLSDSQEYTAMHLAIQTDREAVVAHLLNYQPNLTLRTNDVIGFTVLHLAVEKNLKKLVKLLLKHGAPFDIPDKRRKSHALHYAASNGYTAMVRWFLNKSLKTINAQNKLGQSALHLAATSNLSTLKVLLKQGADPNIQDDLGIAPLHVAAMKNQKARIKLLLKYGANPRLKDKEGFNAFQYYFRNEYTSRYLSSWQRGDMKLSVIDALIHALKIRGIYQHWVSQHLELPETLVIALFVQLYCVSPSLILFIMNTRKIPGGALSLNNLDTEDNPIKNRIPHSYELVQKITIRLPPEIWEKEIQYYLLLELLEQSALAATKLKFYDSSHCYMILDYLLNISTANGAKANKMRQYVTGLQKGFGC